VERAHLPVQGDRDERCWESGSSNVVSARPFPPVPQPPTGMQIMQAGDRYLTLGWNSSPTPGVWYQLTWSVASNMWIVHGFPVRYTIHTEWGLPNGRRRQFRVTAINMAGESAPSNAVAGTPMPANTSRCSTVTSSYYGSGISSGTGDTTKNSAVQGYDVTGTVCGQRNGFTMNLRAAWSTHGYPVLDGGWRISLHDCTTGRTVADHHGGIPLGNRERDGVRSFAQAIDPSHTYSVRGAMSGAISVRSFVRWFDVFPPSNIIPFVMRTPCF